MEDGDILIDAQFMYRQRGINHAHLIILGTYVLIGDILQIFLQQVVRFTILFRYDRFDSL
jgi:hypothetical protein